MIQKLEMKEITENSRVTFDEVYISKEGIFRKPLNGGCSSFDRNRCRKLPMICEENYEVFVVEVGMDHFEIWRNVL